MEELKNRWACPYLLHDLGRLHGYLLVQGP
jgi:hypothetical protein